MSRFDSCIWSDAGDALVEGRRIRIADLTGSTPVTGSVA